MLKRALIVFFSCCLVACAKPKECSEVLTLMEGKWVWSHTSWSTIHGYRPVGEGMVYSNEKDKVIIEIKKNGKVNLYDNDELIYSLSRNSIYNCNNNELLSNIHFIREYGGFNCAINKDDLNIIYNNHFPYGGINSYYNIESSRITYSNLHIINVFKRVE
jgi:hypothetical protein